MKKNNKIFDDISKITGSMFNTMVNVKRDLGEVISEQVSKIIKKQNLVTRAEFEALKKLASGTKHDLDLLIKGGDKMKKKLLKKLQLRKLPLKKLQLKKQKNNANLANTGLTANENTFYRLREYGGHNYRRNVADKAIFS